MNSSAKLFCFITTVIMIMQIEKKELTAKASHQNGLNFPDDFFSTAKTTWEDSHPHYKTPEDLDYMVLIGQKLKDSGLEANADIQFFCSGVLISDSWLLSAAHCFVKRDLDVIQLRKELHMTTVEESPQSVTFEVEPLQGIIFPTYNFSEAYDDLVLIRMNSSYLIRKYNLDVACVPLNISENSKSNSALVRVHGITFERERLSISRLENKKCESYIENSPEALKTKFQDGVSGEGDGTPLAGCVSIKGPDNKTNEEINEISPGSPIVYKDANGLDTISAIVTSHFLIGVKGVFVIIPLSRKHLKWIYKEVFNETIR